MAHKTGAHLELGKPFLIVGNELVENSFILVEAKMLLTYLKHNHLFIAERRCITTLSQPTVAYNFAKVLIYQTVDIDNKTVSIYR